MKKTIVATGVVLAITTSLAVAGTATKTPTAGINAPPRDPTQVGITRTAVQDSTLAGGAGWSPDDTRIRFCTLNPTDPSCGGGGTTNPPPPPVPAAPIRGGCAVDTVEFDVASDGDCFGVGYTITDMIVFSVGDTLVGDTHRFTNPALYTVQWSGAVCQSGSGVGAYANMCFVHAPGAPWRTQLRFMDVVVRRVSDGGVAFSRRIRAEKYTCNEFTTRFGCPEMP